MLTLSSAHGSLSRRGRGVHDQALNTDSLNDQAITLRTLSKHFGQVRAVDEIDMTIHRGETVALLGPNGAGKSTTIALLLGLLVPTSGTVSIFGQPPRAAIQQSRIGAMLQDGKLMAGIRVGEFLGFVRGLHPRPLSYTTLLEIADLGNLVGRRIEKLSGGETQRLRFATAIAGDPDILVLDEPTAAMDVEARRAFWVSMHDYADRGHTVLFATHYLDEAQSFASRLVIIAHGQVIADGSVADIQEQHGVSQVAFRSADPHAPRWSEFPGVTHCDVQGDRVNLRTTDADATARALIASDAPWHALEVTRRDLEEIFLSLVQSKGTMR